MKAEKTKRVFTLIELLVVIAIIGILASMLLPALSLAKEMGRRAQCISQLKSMGLGTSMYTNDSDGYLIPQSQYFSRFVLNGHADRDKEMGLGVLMWRGYVQAGATFKCPSDLKRAYQKLGRYTTKNSQTNNSALTPSYNMQPTRRSYNDTDRLRAVFKVTKSPQDVGDRKFPYAYISDFFEMRGVMSWSSWMDPLSHNKGYNVLFIDGHVKFVSDSTSSFNPLWDGLGNIFPSTTPSSYGPWEFFENN
jgi:prepilin-type N-terminal cleavage/methylation domain-containing protein/prepilin-type processing-associated H-X9-DG protein